MFSQSLGHSLSQLQVLVHAIITAVSLISGWSQREGGVDEIMLMLSCTITSFFVIRLAVKSNTQSSKQFSDTLLYVVRNCLNY